MEVVSTHVVMDIMKMMIPDHVKSVVTNVSQVRQAALHALQ
jgi:hypothetical protein